MSDFEVKGADQFLRLSKALKQAGDTELRKALHKGLRDAAKPLIQETRQEARAKLPKRGGLADLIAKAPQRIQVRTGATPGVRLAVWPGRRISRSALRRANYGVIRHPVFADGDKTRDAWTWVNQPIPSGWFEKPVSNATPDIRRELERVLEDVAEQVVNKARR